MTHLPLFMDLHDKSVVIFGGGHVGEHRTLLFCKHTNVKVISRSFTFELQRMANAGYIELVKTELVKDDLSDIRRYIKGAFLVVAATNDPELNTLIANCAKDCKALINRVDTVGEVIVPSIIHRDNIIIGISTMGKSPASAKFLRLRIEEMMDRNLSTSSHKTK